MSTNQIREAGKRALPKTAAPQPVLRLIRPSSKCSPPDFALDTPGEVKEMLRDMNRKQNVMKESDAPYGGMKEGTNK